MASVASYLIVAGGGGGGDGDGNNLSTRTSGGGGAGGFLTGTYSYVNGNSYPVVVGGGGAGASLVTGSQGTSGSNSSVFSIIATGGGGGGGNLTTTGLNGGSGGGAASTATAGTGIAGQGNAGGTEIDGGSGAGSGGGGASSVGGNGTNSQGGAGGNGTASSISGSSVTYAGGGGGGTNSQGGAGGGGGANTSGTANTGGGGGSGVQSYNAGSGGSGIVIISAPTGQVTNASTAGGTYTTSGGNDIWTFTASGTWAPTGATAWVRSLTDSMMNYDSRYATVSRTYNALRSLSASIMNAVSRLTTLVSVLTTVVNLSIINLSVSGYKWFTSTLWAAQQSSAVKPYFTARILDDSISFTQKIAPLYGPAYGKCITAPDGTILCAGYNTGISGGGSGIYFWKVTDPSASNWSGYATVIDDISSIPPLNNFCSIACSEYINGTYRIDIYYAYNNSGNVGINHKYSNDGGVTWNAGYTVAAPGTIPFSDIQGVYNFCIQAGKPILLSNGTIQSILFYIQKNANSFSTGYIGYDLYYQRYPGTGTAFNAATKWSQENVNSQDWTIHSFDVQYFNEYPNTQQTGQWLIVMSAFHNLLETVNSTLTQANANYGLYLTYLENPTDSVITDVWKEAVEILPTLSNSSLNLDAFTFPELRFDGTSINLLCRAITTESASSTESGSSSLSYVTHTNYYLLSTQDGKNFSYPTAICSSSGEEFTDPVTNSAWGFVFQKGSYWVLGSNGNIGGLIDYNWQFAKNNVIADVTNSIIAYQVNDTVASASSISLTIGNQGSQWYGNTPTQPGYSAIKKNAKICITEGYYNANSVGEAVPRNIYYIDDIQQNVSATANDLVLLGRDLYKRLMVTVTRFAFSLIGPYFYSDGFNGSTIGNWNQVNGSWEENNNSLSLITPATNGADSVVVLSGVNQTNPSALMAVTFALPTGSTNPVFIYPYYQDTTHWIRLEISNLNDGNNHMVWAITYMFAGTSGTFDSGTFSQNVYSSSFPNYTFLVRRYDWFKFSFFVGANSTPTGVNDYSGNTPFMFSTGNSTNSIPTIPTMFSDLYLTGGSTNGEFDASAYFDTTPTVTGIGTVGMGTNGTILPEFKYFKFCEFTSSQNISEIQKFLGVKAGIFNYKLQNTIEDYLYTATNDYNGTFTVTNRELKIAAGNLAINNISSNQLSNAEVEFDAQIIPTNSANDSGFSFIFRSNSSVNTTDSYFWNNGLRNSGAFSYSRFQLNTNQTIPFTYSGTFLLNSSSLQYEISTIDPYNTPIYTNNLNIDFTKWNHFKIIMTDGWFLGFINGVMVVVWQDNNTTQAYLTSGYWGFQSDTNSTVKIKNITSSTFWTNVQTFSLSPGDDMESAMEGIEQTVFGWHFSDLLGRFKNKLFNSTDPSNYTYKSSIVNQQLDASDKEYVNQVKVYGINGIFATARDATSISVTGSIREKVVTDFKIQTYQDAQNRANQELIDAEKFSNQYTPSQTLNVGSELFDVVTIINTGTNSSGINSTSRNYGQTISVGGTSAANYSLQLDTGNL